MKTFITFILLLMFFSAAGAQGSLLLIGGGSDTQVWADDPFEWFVIKADSGIIFDIDTNSDGGGYASEFRSHGADPACETLIISTKTMANDSTLYKKLITAKGIFMHGGNQWPYITTWKGTLVEDAIHYIFENGGAVGGTSAGLAVLGDAAVSGKYSLSPYEAAHNPYDADVHFEDDFLEVLPGVITDSHVHQRGRLGRLVPLMARRIQDFGDEGIIGIGVSEESALCIEADKTAAAYGESCVTILYPSPDSFIRCKPGQPVTFTNINFDQLIPGCVYDLNSMSLTDPGPYLQAAVMESMSDSFTDTTLDGGSEQTIELGQYKVTNLTTGEYNAWRGRLNEGTGSGIVPNTVIIPKVYNDNTYDENRWVGGMWICANHPGTAAIYLDNDCQISASENGILSTNELLHVLDSYGASYTGINGYKTTDHNGLIGAKLHFIGPEDRFDLKNRQAVTSIESKNTGAVATFKLFPNYPNPFNASTAISYRLSASSDVELKIYDTLGHEAAVLVSERQAAGNYTIKWDAQGLASGIYVCRLSAGSGRVQIRKMVLIK